MENLEQNQPEQSVTQPQPTAGGSSSSLTPQPATQPLAPELKPKNPYLLPILLSLVILLLGGVLVFAYFIFLKPQKMVSQPTASPTVVPSPTSFPSPSPDPTAGWETIENDNGYKISYPATLEAFSDTGMKSYELTVAAGIRITEKGGGYHEEGSSPWLGIYVFNPAETKYKTTSLKEFAEANFNDNTRNEGTFIKIIEGLHESEFEGESSYEYTIQSKGFFGVWTGFLGEEGICKIIIFEHNNKFFLIGYYDNLEFRQILSTFEFTD